MRLQDDIDFTTLSWVKRELDETLKQARQALEAYVEDPSDTSQMRFCATYLHQVQGTLRMVELYGASMVVDEMEKVASALLDNQIEEPADAYEVLIRGMVQLPDYLERLQGGHKDIPVVLLPLLNELRRQRGEDELSEMALFSPKLDVDLPDTASGPARPVADVKLRAATVKLRKAFEAALLQWVRATGDDTAIVARMAAICDKLASVTTAVPPRRLWWIAAGVLHGAKDEAIEVSRPLKLLFGRVDQEIKRQALKGESALEDGGPDELSRQLLYHAANGESRSARISELQTVFDLPSLTPDAEELAHAQGSLTGHNRALLDTVTGAIKEDLMRVKDGLDLRLRQGDVSTEGYEPLVETLDKVADTLGMLGLEEPRSTVLAERDRLDGFAKGSGEGDESALMDVASSMLYVEASLDDYLEQLGSGSRKSADESGQLKLGADLPAAEVRRILDALMKESSDNLQEIKRGFIEFIEAPWDHERIRQAPRLLEEIVGGLRMLELHEAGDLLEDVIRFIDTELLRKREVPSADQLDTLADAVASIEYFLEAVREHRPGREKILKVARASLDRLGYLGEDGQRKAAEFAGAPEAEAREARDEELADVPDDVVLKDTVEMPAMDIPDMGAPANADDAEPEVGAPPAAEEAPTEPEPVENPEVAASEAPAAATTEPAGADIADDIDEEIREVFIEEVEEELATLQDLYPKWRSDTDDQDTLTTIRRTFHTLKGSGRLVGAYTIGEFSWQIENLLNRVLDGTREPTASVLELMDAAVAALPQLLANVKGEGRPSAEIEIIKTTAERLAGGEEVSIKGTPIAPTAVVEEEEDEVELATGRALEETDERDQPEEIAAAPTIEEAADADQEVESGEAVAAAEDDFGDLELTFDEAEAKSAETEDAFEPELEIDLGEVEADDAFDLDLSSEQEAEAEADVEGVEGAAESAPAESAFEGDEIDFSAVDDAAEEAAAEGEDFEDFDFGLELEADEDSIETAERAETEQDYSLDLSLDEETDRDVDAALEELSAGMGDEEKPEDHGVSLESPRETDSEEEGFVGEDADAVDAWIADSKEIEEGAEAATEDDESYDLSGLVDTGELSAVDDDRTDTLEVLSMDDVVDEDEAETATLESEESTEDDFAELSLTDEDLAAVDLDADDEPDDQSTAEGGTELEIEFEPESETESEADSEAVFEFEPAADTESDASADELGFDVAAELESTDEEIETAEDEGGAIDPVLLDILCSEVATHLVAIRNYLEEAESRDNPPPATEVLLRAVHTLNGAVAMVEVGPLTQVTGPLERYVKRLRLLEEPPSKAGIAAMHDSVKVVEATVAALGQPAPDYPDVSELSAQLRLLSDGLPEPSDTSSLFPVDEEHPVAETEPALEDVTESSVEDEATDEEMAVESGWGMPAAGEEATDLGFDLDEEFDEPESAEEFTESAEADDTGAVETAELDESTETVESEPEEEFAADEAEPETAEEAEEPAFMAFDADADEVDDAAESDAELTDEAFDEEAATLAAEEPEIDEEPADVAEPPEPELEPEPEAEPEVTAPAAMAPLDEPETIPVAALGDIDEELMEIFLEEGAEILDEADHKMVEWRDDPTDTDVITELQRALHTLKGGARMAGIAPVGDLSHAMESLFEAAVEETVEITTPVVELMEHSFDRLHQMLDRVGKREPIPTGDQLVARMEAVLAGQSIEAAAEAAPETRAEAPAPVARQTALDQEEEQRGFAPSRAQHELIRVRANLLDNLVNYAGEVSIYRARLEQQVGSFRFNLVEFDQTVARLRDQLRKLEIETEAQILSRYQRENEDFDEDFDPLELDRFSQLQQYSRALAESVADLVSIQNLLEDITRESETLLLQQSRVNSDLQEGLMRTRMVPFESLVPRLRRILRQTSQELEKKAQLRVEGAQGEMDRTVLERITAPLEHMLRNAVAHGLESPEERRRQGKPAEGAIRMHVSREATEVVIKVSDDGSGIDHERVRRKAVERGLLKQDAQLSERDLFGFILESGFSTAEDVSKIAGRGVGMDVVASEIKQLGGTLDISSKRGEGTTFTIRLPFTLAVTHAIMVRTGDVTFAIPLSSIEGVARIKRPEFDRRIAEGDTEFESAGQTYQLQELNMLLGIEKTEHIEGDMLPLLLSRVGDQRAAIRIDQVMSSREIVVKSVGPQISSIPGIFGATILGDGSVIMILDLGPLIRRGAALRLADLEESEAMDEVTTEAPAESEAEAERQPLIMVVDDSITMRKVTSRVLQRHDMEVITAKDGVDAVEQLQERIPDLMLLDIEMPRMDGYELATHMRNDDRLRNVPIIMITSRTGEKHRQRALEIGVNRYLGKPYQEADLLENVKELLDETVGTD